MPYRRRGSYRRGPVRTIIKNSAAFSASTGTTQTSQIIAQANDIPDNTASFEVKNGCHIKAIWLSIDLCDLAATGVLQQVGCYLFKNMGNNLVAPSPFTVGNSNEKRFVIKEWSFMQMRNQDGNPPYHWEGWIKIPRYHQRMGTDDSWSLQFLLNTAAGHMLVKFVYKWEV